MLFGYLDPGYDGVGVGGGGGGVVDELSHARPGMAFPGRLTAA